jgi:hypothetical protein
VARITDIKGYWPEVISKIKEYGIIAVLEDPELSAIWSEIDGIYKDQYISTATEVGLAKYEAALGIVPKLSDTLQERRFRALARWADIAPYTWRTMLSRLDALSGTDNYEVSLDAPACRLELVTHLGTPGAIDEVTRVLEEIAPANLLLDINNLLQQDGSQTLSLGSAASQGYHYTLTSDINTIYDGEGDLTNGSVSVVGNKYEIT